ncbi:MAG: TPM domain-containing protein, partial [Herbaspirillum sp.]
VEIIADRGVVHVLKEADWHAICHTMTSGFAHHEFHDSTLTALQQLNALLETHFPNNGATSTQLPDEPIVL